MTPQHQVLDDPRCVNPVRHRGMSLRDYFAANATDADVAAMRGNVPTCTKVKNGANGTKHFIHGAEPDNWRALARYMHADLMLACRKTPNVRANLTKGAADEA